MKRINIAINAAKDAGKIVKEGFFKTHKAQETKTHSNDILTKYDLASQKIILAHIQKQFPNDEIIAEEDGLSKTKTETGWVIDPIDGTNPFSRGIPTFAIVIGYMEKFEAQFCVAFNPVTDEFLVAEKGKGCTLNGKKITIPKRPFDQQLVNLEGFGISLQSKLRAKLTPFVYTCIGRSTGAYSTIMVTRGQSDAYVTKSKHIWDRIHYILLSEAGAKLTNFEGKKYTVDQDEYIACHPTYHKKYLKIINEIYKPKRKK